jgi:hypothetical protein
LQQLEHAMKFWPILIATFLAACGESAQMAPSPEMASPAPELHRMQMEAGAQLAADATVDQASPADQTGPRYLAERQYWVFELSESDIEPRWQAHIALCRRDCEVLNAGLHKSAHQPVRASLQLRVGRASADKLLGAMRGPDITEQRVEREDKTLQVIDLEARLKNLTELRERLRDLLSRRTGTLKDILETERELAKVQGELDSMLAQRKVLANETEKILLYAEYRPKPSIGETGVMQPLSEAWHGAGRAFAESLSEALLFIVRILPWLVIVLPLLWAIWSGLRLIRQRWRQRRRED